MWKKHILYIHKCAILCKYVWNPIGKTVYEIKASDQKNLSNFSGESKGSVPFGHICHVIQYICQF